ncbi:copper chaperone [Rufibacter immobilis]|uniref:Copper chaperone n=1 Tax=Rufibacter immobilis TaxID=1348778 RepID=A0A3M9N2J9_9BACT|nr:heavy-metal-associated domain-containing protein [Rufibacter immobilis]RNI32032.1 copper chaperone [Rufibacter immobilis]
MELLKFKTNVQSSEQIEQVTPFLEKLPGIENWKIDVGTEENILSISGTNLNPQKIENAVKKAGYTAELLRVLGIGGQGL